MASSTHGAIPWRGGEEDFLFKKLKLALFPELNAIYFTELLQRIYLKMHLHVCVRLNAGLPALQQTLSVSGRLSSSIAQEDRINIALDCGNFILDYPDFILHIL